MVFNFCTLFNLNIECDHVLLHKCDAYDFILDK